MLQELLPAELTPCKWLNNLKPLLLRALPVPTNVCKRKNFTGSSQWEKKKHFTKQLRTATWRPGQGNRTLPEQCKQFHNGKKVGVVEATEATFELEWGMKWLVQRDEVWDGARVGRREAEPSRVLLPCLGVLWVTGTPSQPWQAQSNTPNICLWSFPKALVTKHLQTMLGWTGPGLQRAGRIGGG